MPYQIKSVSEMLGIPRNTLIAWERRYDIVEPDRTSAGYRIYRDEHIEVLRQVKELIDAGHKVGEACRILKKQRKALRGPTPQEDGGEASSSGGLGDIRDELLEALLGFDRAQADRLALRLVMVPFERALEEVYFPLLYEVGERWEKGEITVVQEHYATAYCREKLLVMIHSVRSAGAWAPEVTCAMPPGEHHELGLLALALRLAMRGFRVTYLGANVPASELARHIQKRRPQALCLSFVQQRPQGEVAQFARELRRDVPDEVRIVFGGRGTRHLTALDVPGVELTGDEMPSWLADPGQLARAAR